MMYPSVKVDQRVFQIWFLSAEDVTFQWEVSLRLKNGALKENNVQNG